MSIPDDLAALLAEARSHIPLTHRSCPIDASEAPDLFTNPDQALLRLNDWAFCEGHAFVTASKDPNRGRAIYRCIRHSDGTRNTRKTEETDKRRPNTRTKQLGCPVRIEVLNANNCWYFLIKESSHGHEPHANPFIYLRVHGDRRPNLEAIRKLHLSHRNVLTYSKSAEIVKREGYMPLSAQEYHNLKRHSQTGSLLSNEEEYKIIEAILTKNDFRMRTRTEYTTNQDGIRQANVVRDLFFCSSDQIKLARRFVSDFAYITDATFRTNRRRFPLSIVTGITNTGHTFQFGYMYILSESAVAFQFMEDVLTELVFHDRPLPKVVLGDFAKGLAALYTANPAPIPPVDDETELVEIQDDNQAEELAEALENAVGTTLQL